MSHILLNGKYNKEIRKLIPLKLLLWIKRAALIYYRGKSLSKYKVKKENKISNFRTAVTFKSHCGLFAFKNRNNLSQSGRACKQTD